MARQPSFSAEGIAMNVRGLLGGIVAGVIGAAAWCAVAYYANLEIGYLAWGIGAFVGLAVAACGQSPGPAAGALAVAITVISIVLGKYATVEVMIQKDLAELLDEDQFAPENFEEPALIAALASEIVEQQEQQGKQIVWPDVDEDSEDVSVEESYPRDIWAQARKQWAEMDAQQQSGLRQQTSEESKAMLEQISGAMLGEIRQGGFINSFGLMDLLFFGLAIATAWGIAVSGGEEA